MLVIVNIAKLCTGPTGPTRVDAALEIRRYRNAAIGIRNGLIEWIQEDFRGPVPPGSRVIDARGGCALPGLIDCHTHTVFAGTREAEFVQRIEGRSYAEIAESGGGIRVTVEAVRKASIDDLVRLALPRLRRMLSWGVTTVEIKSGYGLTVEDELKMLAAIRRLREAQPIEVVATYLAAHTVPAEMEGRADDYLDQILDDQVLRHIADEGLAEAVDVFCERTAFDVPQARRVLEAGKRFGLWGRVHADQITQMGASALAAEMGAASADHLETLDDAGIQALKQAGTVAVLLPACSFYLGVPQAPARRIIDAGIPVAVATDYNPGSSVIESLPLTLAIACTQARMTPAQAMVAATANPAAVLGRQSRLGAIERGMQADIVLLDVPSIEQWCYFAGRNCTRAVIKNGHLVYESSQGSKS